MSLPLPRSLRLSHLTLGTKFFLVFGGFSLAFLSLLSLGLFTAVNAQMEVSLRRGLESKLSAGQAIVQTAVNSAVRNYLRHSLESSLQLLRHRQPAAASRDADWQALLAQGLPRGVAFMAMDANGRVLQSTAYYPPGTELALQRDALGHYVWQGLLSSARELPAGDTDHVIAQLKTEGERGARSYLSVFAVDRSRGWILVQSAWLGDFVDFIDAEDFRDDLVALRDGANGSVEIFDSHDLQVVHSAPMFQGIVRKTALHERIKLEGSGLLETDERLVESSSLAYVTTSAQAGQGEMIRKLYAFASLPDLGWWLAIGVDRGEALAGSRALLLAMLLGTLVFLASIWLVTWILVKRMIGRRLQILGDAVDRFASNDLDVRVKLENHDETGRLAHRFNQMADTIEASTNRLENLVTERTRELVRSEKMAALGGLVAGIAHEINTPLGVSITASSYLHSKVSEIIARMHAGGLTRSEFDEFLNQLGEESLIVLRNLQRASDLIGSFKQIAVDQSHEAWRDFELGAYLQSIFTSLRPKLRPGKHQVELDCPPALAMTGPPGSLISVFSNLVSNSILHGFEHQSGGRIRVAVRLEGDQVLVEYSDNGQGIPQENLLRIFEPFFTTKRGKGGSGLGLHIAWNIVTQIWGGSIECQSLAGEGTRFFIRLCRVARPVAGPGLPFGGDTGLGS